MNCIYNATGSYVCQPMPKNQPKNGSTKPNDSCPSCSLRNQVGSRREVVGEYQSTFNMAEIYEDVRFKGRSASPRMARTESPRMARVESPLMTRSVSPLMARAESPRMARTVSPRMARVESPRMARTELPRMARVESPRARARSEVARVLAEGKRN